MDRSLQSSFAVVHRKPALLLGPILSAKVVTFALMAAVTALNHRYFPIIRTAPHAGGVRLDPTVLLAQSLAGLEVTLARGSISLLSQIADYMLEGLAIALTVVLATEIYRHGGSSLRSGVQRLKEVPSLGSILFRFIVRYILVVFAIGFAISMLLLLLLLVQAGGARHGLLPVPSGSSSLSNVAALALAIDLILAYLLVPYFLQVVLKIQQQTRFLPAPPSMVKQLLHFAWGAAAVKAMLLWITGHVNLAIAGGSLITNTPLHWMQRLSARLITGLPMIWFVVATAVAAAPAVEPVTDAEQVATPIMNDGLF